MPTLKGESFSALLEKRPSFFQQLQQPKEADFYPNPILDEQEEEADSSPPMPEPEEKVKKEDLEMLRQQGEEIIAEAIREAKKIKEEAFRQGLAQGKEEGRKKVISQLLPLENSLKHLIGQVEQVQEAVLKKQEQEIIHLCTKMAQKIIHTEIQQNPELILANLREGLKSIGHHKVVALKLNPQDIDILQKLRGEISRSILDLEGVTLEGDPGLLPGGCLIQTDLGYVDASIETQLQELEKTFGVTT